MRAFFNQKTVNNKLIFPFHSILIQINTVVKQIIPFIDIQILFLFTFYQYLQLGIFASNERNY
jgi:hypothetical protein